MTNVVEREPGSPRLHLGPDRADVLVKAFVFLLVVVLAFMVLRIFDNPGHYVILASAAVAVAVFGLLGVHLAVISVYGLSVSGDHFIPPHQGFSQVFTERRRPVPLDDVAGAELIRSSTGRVSFLRLNILNRNPVVLKKGDYGVSAGSFEMLVEAMGERKKLDRG